MKLQEIYATLNEISPFELQEKWDNSGLLVGNMQSDIEEIVLSLDIDEELIENAKEGTLFVVHHPLIFSKLAALNSAYYPANLLAQMVKKDISLIAMHTNLDKTHLNKYVFEEVLGLELESQSDFICATGKKFKSEDILALLGDKLSLNSCKVVNYKDEVDGISLTTGAGASLIGSVETECFLTGDIKYHDAMKAMSENKMLIDIGHFESEQFFVDVMFDLLNSMPISVIIAQSKNPFETFSIK